jgi:hypothetical protein
MKRGRCLLADSGCLLVWTLAIAGMKAVEWLRNWRSQ